MIRLLPEPGGLSLTAPDQAQFEILAANHAVPLRQLSQISVDPASGCRFCG